MKATTQNHRRRISTCATGEAFKFKDEWFTLIRTDFRPLLEWKNTFPGINNLICNSIHEHSTQYFLQPCFNLSTSSFVFISNSCVVEEWAKIENTFSTHS